MANFPKGQLFAKNLACQMNVGHKVGCKCSSTKIIFTKTTFLLICQTYVPAIFTCYNYGIAQHTQRVSQKLLYFSVSSEVSTTTASATVTISILTTVKGIFN